jgi:acyl-coenzyme A synthetase/AMP-(fatty) acid ligase
MNLFDAIFTHDSTSPAIYFGRREITYGELRAETLRMAQVIRSLGAKPGDRIGLLLHDSPEFVEAFIATCSLGAIAVPINMALRAEDQCSILHNSGASFAFMEADMRHELLTHAPEKLRLLKNVVLVGANAAEKSRQEPGTANLYSLDLLRSEADGKPSTEFPDGGPDDAAFILYTSGSTGEPKGAVHRQSDIFYTNQTFCREVLRPTTSDRLFSSSRLPFAYGLGNSFSFPLLNGATTILCRDKPSPDVIAECSRSTAHDLFWRPGRLQPPARISPRSKRLDCSSLRLCVSAGEALPAHLGEEWERSLAFRCLMESVRLRCCTCSCRITRTTCATAAVAACLKDTKQGCLTNTANRRRQGVEGNLWMKGESAAIEYWERPETTAQTFVDGWVRTGDLVSLRRERILVSHGPQR